MSSPKDQLTMGEVAKAAGIGYRSVQAHRERGTIPEPDGHLGTSPWWYRKTVDRWLKKRLPPGRPKAAK